MYGNNKIWILKFVVSCKLSFCSGVVNACRHATRRRINITVRPEVTSLHLKRWYSDRDCDRVLLCRQLTLPRGSQTQQGRNFFSRSVLDTKLATPSLTVLPSVQQQICNNYYSVAVHQASPSKREVWRFRIGHAGIDFLNQSGNKTYHILQRSVARHFSRTTYLCVSFCSENNRLIFVTV
jgi:hypothetical protein